MNDLLAYFTLRTFFVFFSTAFSIFLLMLILNIITVDEVITMLNLSPEAANAVRTVALRIQEVTNNIVNIISQLLNKLFNFAGAEVDLTKVKVDPNAMNDPNSGSK